MSTCARILMVGPLPPPSGGMANQTRQLAALLSAEGMAVRIVRTNEPYAPDWVGRIPGVRALCRLLPYLWRLWRETARADVVHVMANSGWAWFLFAAPAIHIAALRDVPVLVNYRGGLAREFLARSARRVLPTLRRARMVVVPSAFLSEVFGAHGVTTTVIPNIVDTRAFTPDRNDVKPAPGAHVVISRNLEAVYGIDTALRALALVSINIPAIRASIAGTGPDRAALEALATKLGISDRVHFTGRLDVPDMAEMYRSGDLVLNPSRADNMPNSVLEALACGIPVVSTSVGGVPYLVQHGHTAWLVAPDDPAAMAEGMTRVLGDDELRSRLRREGLAMTAEFSWPKVKERWLGAYRAVTA